ncbi:unnamed protein product [Strongylus vulgaris]|uniref:Uncharacterized protein n=1 Tax=Strongylus vulgaris TaxID=40348 RepID=A0A3P7LJB1_STRVU|nr:unnamed protein product [Strongylus vulgaris]
MQRVPEVRGTLVESTNTDRITVTEHALYLGGTVQASSTLHHTLFGRPLAVQ